MYMSSSVLQIKFRSSGGGDGGSGGRAEVRG